MNILLTNECNRRCPYCFAGERISFPKAQEGESKVSPAPRFLSETDFARARAFARNSGLQRISLLGGEPTVHPEFTSFLKQACEDGFHATVFTNGLWRKQLVEEVAPLVESSCHKVNFVVNVNQPEELSLDEQAKLDRLFNRLGKYCSLSFNIYREDFKPDFLVDLISEYRLAKNIRLGIAVPLARQESQHVAVDRYDVLAPTILALAARCDAEDIRLGFDCGFLLCMFSSEELGQLQMCGAFFKSNCGPAIDIGTDLTVWSCFPLSTFSSGVHLDSFSNLDGLIKHFNSEYGRLFKAGAMEKCMPCKFRRRGQCIGGCAAHVYRRMNP